MAEREDEELQMALRMSLQGSPPEAKRSKPWESAEESVEARNRRLQRELMASAAEKRIRAAEIKTVSPVRPVSSKEEVGSENVTAGGVSPVVMEGVVSRASEQMVVGSRRRESDAAVEISMAVADQLFSMVFGSGVSKDILAQWCNQGIRFSSDPETSIGLVQHEGGPCGVLATIQAFVLKYLLFIPDDLSKCQVNLPSQSLGSQTLSRSSYLVMDDLALITEERKARSQHILVSAKTYIEVIFICNVPDGWDFCVLCDSFLLDFPHHYFVKASRALVYGMLEILFLCGNKKRAVVTTLSVLSQQSGEDSEDSRKIEMIGRALEGLSVESATDLQKIFKVRTCSSHDIAFGHLMSELPVFQSRMGALLFLISALLSRGLEAIQADRDDPSLPLVTAPFGHASQEIVNLLLCGQAVPNVFDGSMDLGSGMSLKGIQSCVEVGFLTLLESLNFCKVGQRLKCPRLPIWVVGSESHYTVLFALDSSVQEENELEERESRIRQVFDSEDQSGGGGFISVEGFQKVLRECSIDFPRTKLDSLCSSGFIVWSELWQALMELEKEQGGLKDSSGLMGKKQFDIYHFNGIAKSVSNGNPSMVGGESPLQRPRLCKLSVSVPPRWTQEEFLAESRSNKGSEGDQSAESNQHAPLVDCIRTRWPRAGCSWVGDAPSIV
ncbi:hypothetical protein AXF42_Ash018814 [Apostasia shenzhenica]|uniref:Deubiquitinating enzyme MINDY-3/4 conserved domain-containing protein n=1 Tax=Apostasia shenzhenica TaxID=1088818 RepID=A0A2I0B158_9ASPA|nr:hypothetical protein AXF42_Ash018814 [Apostasia shenzhenica]